MRIEGELRRSRQELRRLAAHLQSVREEEQARIGRELHDELGQSLTALKLDLSWVRRRLAEERRWPAAAPIAEKLRSMAELADHTLSSMRRLALELRPAVLDDLGLEAAVEWQVEEFRRRTGIPCHLACELAGCRPDEDVSTTIYRVLQESLTNVARHAEASEVKVSLHSDRLGMRLEVADDGRGIDMGRVRETSSLGLLTMYERARACGGKLDLVSRPDHGTRVVLETPLEASTPEETRP